MGIALAGVSLPIFFTGLLSLVDLQLPARHRPRPAAATPRSRRTRAMWAYDLILPWITLAFLYAAGYARLTRAGMLETMNEDYIRTARAKGLPERTVVVKHGLRSALTPILTIFGLDLGLLLGGAVLTETTFSLPGIGKYAVDAIVNNDLPKVLGVTLVGGVLHHLRQPDRGHALRRRRPAGAVLSERDTTSQRRDAAGASPAERRADALPRGPRPAGALPDRRRHGQVGRRALVRARARPDPRHRRRVRVRQERDQPVDHGPARAAGGPDLRRDLAGRRGAARHRRRSRSAGCAARRWR